MLTENQIKHMVDRFLSWRLPESFRPDGGVSFKPTFNDHLPTPMRHEPSGTNLFDASQADAMVRYMLDGLPEPKQDYTGMSHDKLLHLLKLRDRQIDTSKTYWIRAAEKALNGDLAELRNRVELSKVKNFQIVQS